MTAPLNTFEDLLKAGIAAGKFADWNLGAVTDKASFMLAWRAHPTKRFYTKNTLAINIMRVIGQGSFPNWIAFCTVPTASQLMRSCAKEAVMKLVIVSECELGCKLHECARVEKVGDGMLMCHVCSEAIFLGVSYDAGVLLTNQV